MEPEDVEEIIEDQIIPKLKIISERKGDVVDEDELRYMNHMVTFQNLEDKDHPYNMDDIKTYSTEWKRICKKNHREGDLSKAVESFCRVINNYFFGTKEDINSYKEQYEKNEEFKNLLDDLHQYCEDKLNKSKEGQSQPEKSIFEKIIEKIKKIIEKINLRKLVRIVLPIIVAVTLVYCYTLFIGRNAGRNDFFHGEQEMVEEQDYCDENSGQEPSVSSDTKITTNPHNGSGKGLTNNLEPKSPQSLAPPKTKPSQSLSQEQQNELSDILKNLQKLFSPIQDNNKSIFIMAVESKEKGTISMVDDLLKQAESIDPYNEKVRAYRKQYNDAIKKM